MQKKIPMRYLLPAICLVTSAVNAAWVIEDIPTAIQYTRGPNLIAKEMASAYRPVL